MQIRCTDCATYALADGILYVSGKNDDGRAGLGHKEVAIAPTPIDFGNRQWVIATDRCLVDNAQKVVAISHVFKTSWLKYLHLSGI